MVKSIFFEQWDSFIVIARENKLPVCVCHCYMGLMYLWNKKFFRNPIYVSGRKMNRQFGVSKNNVHKYLSQLNDAGLIVYKKQKQKSVITIITLPAVHIHRGTSSVPDSKQESNHIGTAIVPDDVHDKNSKPFKQNINSSSAEKENDESNSETQTAVAPDAGHLNLKLFEDVEHYFKSFGFNQQVAIDFCKYNRKQGHAFNDPKKSWQEYAKNFMRRKNRSQDESKQLQEDVSTNEYLYAQGTPIFLRAVNNRVLELMFSNERGDGLLADQYRMGNLQHPLVLCDIRNVNIIMRQFGYRNQQDRVQDAP